MFEKNKKFNLEKYQKQRDGKISMFGISAEFDWMLLNILGLVLIIIVFVFSMKEIKHVLTYEPEPNTEFQTLLRDDKIIQNLEEILQNFEQRSKQD